jgi:hypothetical protein
MVDFASRNPVECKLENCTVCQSIELETQTTFFGAVTTASGPEYLCSTAGWKDIQKTDKDLRRCNALLEAGTKLSPKRKKEKTLRSYMKVCSINREGLMVVKKRVQFQAKPAELIVIPEAFAFTCGKALHVKFNHPTKSQMRKMFDRSYFMLNSDRILTQVWESCDYPCQADRILPKEEMSYKSETIPNRLGSNFHADVLVEAKQKILISRENLSTYPSAGSLRTLSQYMLKGFPY